MEPNAKIEWSYGQDYFIVRQSTDGQGSGGAVVAIPIKTFDLIVRDYLLNRRGAFLDRGMVEGLVFDDDQEDFGF